MATPRLSEMLPTVKCSNCAQPVPLATLTEHICAAVPPLPASPSPSFLGNRPRNLSAARAPASPASPPMTRARSNSTHARSPPPQFATPPPMPLHGTLLYSSPSRGTTPAPATVPATRARSNSTHARSPPPQFAPAPPMPFQGALYSSPSRGMTPAPPPISPAPSHVPFPSSPQPREIDYMPGGASGMAGVGRRAFHAVAHAALFTLHNPHPPSTPTSTAPTPIIGMAGRRPTQPQFLNIPDPTNRGTPPLSPTSGHSSPRSHSPLSPSNTPPLPLSARALSTPTPAHDRLTPPHTAPMPSNVAANSRLPFLDRYKHQQRHDAPSISPTATITETPFGKSDTYARTRDDSNDDDESVGLAYDRDSDSDDDTDPERRSKTESSHYSTHSIDVEDEPTLNSPPAVKDRAPRRSHTTPTIGPRGGPGGVASPLGTHELTLGSSAVRSASDAKRHSKRRPRERECVRCEMKIADGRWIPTDASPDGPKGGVLCERCWKNMYLPKCRRCSLPIEKSAVYSSDGQLKGKYHRECFTCTTCASPFPDRTFYIFDGHPMCALHWHEKNGSLCKGCRRPIEGACAMTEGDHEEVKFHPRCLRCQWIGCDVVLDDYWEVNGLRVCERHAYSRRQQDEEDDVLTDLVVRTEAKAQKRTTRLINLMAPGGLGL